MSQDMAILPAFDGAGIAGSKTDAARSFIAGLGKIQGNPQIHRWSKEGRFE